MVSGQFATRFDWFGSASSGSWRGKNSQIIINIEVNNCTFAPLIGLKSGRVFRITEENKVLIEVTIFLTDSERD